jgi:hypothetical protein
MERVVLRAITENREVRANRIRKTYLTGKIPSKVSGFRIDANFLNIEFAMAIDGMMRSNTSWAASVPGGVKMVATAAIVRAPRHARRFCPHASQRGSFLGRIRPRKSVSAETSAVFVIIDASVAMTRRRRCHSKPPGLATEDCNIALREIISIFIEYDFHWMEE